jgi:hypothetical protein
MELVQKVGEKEEIVSYFKVLFRYCPGRSEVSHKTSSD